MEIFEHNIKFCHWGELYAGLKRGFITPKDILDFCNSDHIIPSDEDRLVKLHLDLEESLFKFLETIKHFIINDNELPIEKNEDELEHGLYYIPSIYHEIWMLEFLLRLRALNYTPNESIEEASSEWAIFNYPKDWHEFVLHAPVVRAPLGVEKMYENMINHIENRIGYFQAKVKSRKKELGRH